MNDRAPVVVFAYRRPDHLRNTLASLMRCDGFEASPVIVYCDGARDPADAEAVSASRMVAREMLGQHAEYHFRDDNLGLARSIISGVNDVVERFGRAVVIEDDLELAPSFLTYMNHALDRYAQDDRVYQVSGYMFDVPELRACSEAVFLPLTVSWGWATWKRAWSMFDPAAAGWKELTQNAGLRHRFNFYGAYDYATMLMRQMAGTHDSWAIRWYWTVFRAEGLVLFPPVSLVRNRGFDGSGSHGRGVLRRFMTRDDRFPTDEPDLPLVPQRRQEVISWVRKAMWKSNGGWKSFIVDRLRRICGR